MLFLLAALIMSPASNIRAAGQNYSDYSSDGEYCNFGGTENTEVELI